MRKVLVTMCLVLALIMTGGVFASEKSSDSGQKKGSTGDKWGNYGSGVDKAAIQAAMLKYIAHKTNYDQTYNLDGRKVTFDYLHGGLKEKGGLYISCVDFKAGRDVYDVDYYVREKKGNHKVVKEVLHKKNGKAINKVLWSKTGKKCSGYEKKSSSDEKKGSGY